MYFQNTQKKFKNLSNQNINYLTRLLKNLSYLAYSLNTIFINKLIYF